MFICRGGFLHQFRNERGLDDGHFRIDRFPGIVDMGCCECLPHGTVRCVP